MMQLLKRALGEPHLDCWELAVLVSELLTSALFHQVELLVLQMGLCHFFLICSLVTSHPIYHVLFFSSVLPSFGRMEKVKPKEVSPHT